MTFENMSSDDRTTEPIAHNGTQSNNQSAGQERFKSQFCSSQNAHSTTARTSPTLSAQSETTTVSTPQNPPQPTTIIKTDQNLNTFILSNNENSPSMCSSSISKTTLDDEIRSRLDKLNALSDLINSLECQFDEANSLFRETLKCSTDRLSALARTIGSKSIRQGRIYNAVKISVEQSQSDCQRACIRFEKANQDHQFAKNAIREAEERLKQLNHGIYTEKDIVINVSTSDSVDTLDSIAKLTLSDEQQRAMPLPKHCDNEVNSQPPSELSTNHDESHEEHQKLCSTDRQQTSSTLSIKDAARYSEELNQGVTRLINAEKERRLSEREHMDRANKLMLDQEKLTKLERDHSLAIRKTQYYFDESRRFNAKLNSVKSDISQINEDILAAKQAYARTLKELEQFSEDLHYNKKFFSD